MHLVLGLGNPGARYERTRHNAGFLVVDRLARRHGASVEKKHLGALVDTVRFQVRSQAGSDPGTPFGRATSDPAWRDVALAKPQSFMNLSGQVAASLRGWYKVADEEIVVVHDEVDLPFGDIRVKKGGGHGGHNGVRDLVEKLGTGAFVRVRFGVGRPPAGWDTADWVLAPFTAEEEAQVPDLVERAADAVELVITDGTERAMNRVNTRAPTA